MSNRHYFSTVYPQHKYLIRFVEGLTLSTRSLLIKLCQAQSVPSDDCSSLAQLLDQEQPVFVQTNTNAYDTMSLRDALGNHNFNPYDPLDSAILLDICRGVSTSAIEVGLIKEKSWSTEVNLVQGTFRNEPLHWDSIFSTDPRIRAEPLHPELPSNPSIANSLHHILINFRRRMAGRTLYSRFGKKNMSYSTRREFEQTMGQDLLNVPIYSQEDWLRLYHETGIQLEGSVEMRQRWYTSGAKPRTYFAMGGLTYRHSRFLQDFFTELVDSLPSTHHKTRLRPGRLSTPTEEDDESIYWRIYDLSSFTSNCCIQRSFVKSLAEFFSGVEVSVVDEFVGPTLVDLGDLLSDYYVHCVEEPLVSLERYDQSFENPFEHEVASMLGIFGNLMSCTFAHASIMLPLTDSFDRYNCAGDDGLIPERYSTMAAIDQGIRIVGSYAREKSFIGSEEGAIHLKRPFVDGQKPDLLGNIIPPSVATVLLVLSDFDDPRFRSFADYSSMPLRDRISIIGKDLLRFLRSAYRLKYPDVVALSKVLRGFKSLVRQICGWNVEANLGNSRLPIWPVDPLEYEFLDNPYDPLSVLIFISNPLPVDQKFEYLEETGELFSEEGDVFEANPDKRLKLLAVLGYLDVEDVMQTVVDPYDYWCRKLFVPRNLMIPPVRRYTVKKDIPHFFVFSPI